MPASKERRLAKKLIKKKVQRTKETTLLHGFSEKMAESRERERERAIPRKQHFMKSKRQCKTHIFILMVSLFLLAETQKKKKKVVVV